MAAAQALPGINYHHPGSSRASGQCGFNLTELMVVLAISSAAMLVAVPLTATWVDSARVQQAQGVFQLAYTKAKASAQRNKNAVTSDLASATLCLNSQTLYVYESTPGSCGTAGFSWKGDLPTGVSITYTNPAASFSCLMFAPTGVPLSGTLGSGSCTLPTTMSYKISKGSGYVENTLF